jgi:hypothetical protein
MIWLNPIAWFAIASVALPILIHLLIQRRAERLPFPTLRFLQPTRLAAIRRHLLEDLPLLAVRIALLAAAVAALAGPLLVTSARRQAWDRRVVRAIVRDSSVGSGPAPASAQAPAGSAEAPEARRQPAGTGDRGRPLREKSFSDASLLDAIQRAILWLDTAPPARREIVVSSALAIDSITEADVAAIPADIGVRFERIGGLPRTRTVPAGRLLTSDGVRARAVTLDGDRTSVREAAAADPFVWPIDVVAPEADRSAADAAIGAVLSQRVWAGPADRRARLLLLQPAAVDADLKVRTTSEVVQASRPAVIQQTWMAGAVSRIAGDRDLRDAAARVTVGMSDTQLSAAPWQVLASAADGRPLAVAAESADRLVVASAARASDLVTPVLLRAIANAIGAPADLQGVEVVPIADAVLQRWSRSAAPVSSPRIESMDEDDRRWLWLAALLLMALEIWIRRAPTADGMSTSRQEDARVA